MGQQQVCPVWDLVSFVEYTPMINDGTLLDRFASEGSQEAFAEFVKRHLPLVFGVAARRLNGDTYAAADIAQVVFLRAARDARQLRRHPVLTGWLYLAVRNAATDRIRSEHRRTAREQTAHDLQEVLMSNDRPLEPEALKPMIDTALDDLPDCEREMVLLRFFQTRSFAEVGAAFGVSEEAARKRIERALDRLRDALARHGITSTAAAVATALGASAAVAAPAGLASSIVTAAAAAGSTALAGISFMTITKLQASAVVALLAAGAVGLVWQHQASTHLQADVSDLQQRVRALDADNQHLLKARAEADANVTTLRAALDQRASTVASALAPMAKSAGTMSQLAALSQVTTEPRVGDPQQIARLHARYDPFLKDRGLTPEQIDRWIALMAEKDNIRRDLQDAVREYNVDTSTKEFQELYGKSTNAQWQQMREILGDDGFKAFSDYEQTSAYRGLVTALQPRMAAVGEQLTSDQSDQLVHSIIANLHSRPKNSRELGTTVQIDWPAVAQQSDTYLSPGQQAVLTKFAEKMK